MVDKICDLKNKLVQELERMVDEKGAARMDSQIVDMVKDLADAERSCWEAEYYHSVVDAMDGSQGYASMQSAPSGYRPYGYQTDGNGRSGWQNQYGSGRNVGRRGYGDYGGYGYQGAVEGVRVAMQSATPEERDLMMGELRGLMGM